MRATVAMPFLYDKREFVAQFGTLLFGGVILLAASHFTLRHDRPPASEPIQISLADIPPVEAPKPQLIEPPPARKIVQKAPVPVPQRPLPQQATPVAATPSPEPMPVAVPDAPVSPAAKTIPAKADPRPQSNAASEGRFAQEVRARIEQKKAYPDTARDLGMSGTVEVLYVLERSGHLAKAEIVSSSGYALLDQAAVRAVRSAAYSPFPEDAWVGEKHQEFRTKVVFSLNY